MNEYPAGPLRSWRGRPPLLDLPPIRQLGGSGDAGSARLGSRAAAHGLGRIDYRRALPGAPRPDKRRHETGSIRTTFPDEVGALGMVSGCRPARPGPNVAPDLTRAVHRNDS